MVARAGPDHGIPERGQWRQTGLQCRETGEVTFVRDHDETAAGTFGRDGPPMDEFVVVRRIGRHDAEDLRDIGGDELLAMRIRAVAQRRARQDVDDHAFVVWREIDRDPVAARDGSRAPAQDAKQGPSIVEDDGVVPSVRGRDQARGRGHGASWSVFAAQMQSFNVTPPASCVDQSMTTCP